MLSGLLRYREGRWERWARDTGFPFDEVIALLEDSRGALWVVGEEAGVVRLDDAGVRHFERSDGIGSTTVYTVAEGPDGAIYLGHGAGIDRIDGERVIAFGNDRGLPALPVRAIHFDGRNGMTLSAGWALWRLDGDRFIADPRQQLIGGEIASIGGDREQNLWIGTVDAGVWRLGFRSGIARQPPRLPQTACSPCLGSRGLDLGWHQRRPGAIKFPFTSIDRRRGLSTTRPAVSMLAARLWIATGGSTASVTARPYGARRG